MAHVMETNIRNAGGRDCLFEMLVNVFVGRMTAQSVGENQIREPAIISRAADQQTRLRLFALFILENFKNERSGVYNPRFSAAAMNILRLSWWAYTAVYRS